MTSNLNYYKARIVNKYNIPRSFLESGTILEMVYKPNTERYSKHYFIIVLHPGYGPFPDKLLHAITLENFQSVYFKQFVDQIGLEPSQHMKNIRKIALEKLIMDKKDARKFYLNEIKTRVNKFEDCYRTFLVNNIQRIQIIDFKFDNKQVIVEKSFDKQLNTPENQTDVDKQRVINKYFLPNNDTKN
jgi:hypothetical protein